MKTRTRIVFVLFTALRITQCNYTPLARLAFAESQPIGAGGMEAGAAHPFTEATASLDFALSSDLAVLDWEGGKSEIIGLRNAVGCFSAAVDGKDWLWLYILDAGGVLRSSFEGVEEWSFQVVAAQNPSSLSRTGSITFSAEQFGIRHSVTLTVRQKGSVEADHFCAAAAPYRHEKKALPGCPICDYAVVCSRDSAIAVSYIAESAYGSTPASSDPADFQSRTGISSPNETKDPNAYFGAVQTDDGTIVIVSFAGTQYNSGSGKYITDWTHNLNALAQEGIHGGYMHYFNDFLDKNMNKPLLSIRFPNWARDMDFKDVVRAAGAGVGNIHFLLTGHSLGGALAQIMTYWLIEQGVDTDKIVTYTYGSPGPFTAAFISENGLDSHDSALHVYNFSNPADIITKAGVWLFAGVNINGEVEFFEVPEEKGNPHSLETYRTGINQERWVHLPD